MNTETFALRLAIADFNPAYQKSKSMPNQTKHTRTGEQNDGVQHPDAPVKTGLIGYELINDPALNKGTAFTEAERDLLHHHGLLPHVGTLDDQVSRRIKMLRRFGTNFERYAFLRELQDSNEALFYAVL